MTYERKTKLAGAALIVTSSMIVSRITGFLRSTLIPNMLGKNGIDSDALMASFKTTDLMYNLLVGGSIAAALIPVLSGYLIKDEEEEGWKAVSSFINIVFIAMVAVSILGVIYAPQVVQITAPGLNQETKVLASRLVRILFPSVAFIMLAGITNGVLNSYQRFAAAAYGPAVYNTGTALSIILFHKLGVEKVAVGIACSAFVYFMFQLSFAVRNMKFYRLKIFFKHSGFIRLVRLAIPSLLASSIAQVNTLISQIYTSGFDKFSLTANGMANDTWQLPYGIFAMGLGTAILPTLSERIALGDVKGFKHLINKGMKTVLLITIPSGVAFIILRQPVISVIYKWTAALDEKKILLASSILMFFAIALLAQSILAIINRAFYANNDTRMPLYIGASSIVMNALLCFIFNRYTSLDVTGMSLAYSISSTFNAIVLLLIIDKRFHGIDLSGLSKFILKVLFASGVMGVVLYFVNRFLPVNFLEPFRFHAKLKEIFFFFIEVIIGISVYFPVVILMKMEEAVHLKDLVLAKLESILKSLKGNKL